MQVSVVPSPGQGETTILCEETLTITSTSITFVVSWDDLGIIDLDVNCIAFNVRGDVVDTAYYGKLMACGGTVMHSGLLSKQPSHGALPLPSAGESIGTPLVPSPWNSPPYIRPVRRAASDVPVCLGQRSANQVLLVANPGHYTVRQYVQRC